jgi:hypothetical protein
MAFTSAEVAYLRSQRLARLATVAADGSVTSFRAACGEYGT